MPTWDSQAIKVVPVTADEVLIIDTEDSRNQKRVTLSSLPFAATTSNVGLGEGLALPPVVNDFPFKSLIGVAPITLTGNPNDVTFSLDSLNNDQFLNWKDFADTSTLGIKINTANNLETNSRTLLMKPDDLGTSRIIMNRDDILVDNSIVGEVRAVAKNDAGTSDIEYGQLSLYMEKDDVGLEDGSFIVRLKQAGVDTEFLTINQFGIHEIGLHNTLNMNNSIIKELNDPVAPADAANKFYVDDADGVHSTADRDRTNHTGTQLHTTISDFDAGVQTNSPDQLAAIPIGNSIDWVGGKGLTLNSSDEMVSTAKRIVIDTTDTARYVFFRNTPLVDDQPIGNFRAIAKDSGGNIKEFGQLTFVAAKTTPNLIQGEFSVRIAQNLSNVDVFKINEFGDNRIQLLKEVTLAGNILDDAVIQNSVIENLSPNVTYVKTEEDFGLIPPPVAVDSFSDAGGGEMNVITAVGHGLVVGNVVVFSGGTPYDGVNYEVVETQAAAAFKVVETFTSSSTGTSTAKKRQLFDTNNLTRLFYMMDEVNLTAPLLMTASGSQQVQYIFIQDNSEVNKFIVDYTDSTLGAPFQGENIFSLVRVKVGTELNATLMAANVKTVDVGFSSSSFEFFLDDQVSDFGSIAIKGVAFARIINTSFYFQFDEGLQFTDCGSIEISDTGFNPNSSLTTPVIEILEPGGNPTNARFNNLDMAGLATGKNAIKIPAGLDPQSRISVTNCSVPSDANLFDATGLDQTDIKVLARGNIGHPDSHNIGSTLTNGNTTVTTIATQGVWVDLNLDTNAVAGSNIERWSLDDTTTGELQYDGLEDFSGTLNAAIVVEPNGSKIYNIRAVKNGIVLSDTAVSRVAISGTLTSIPFTVPISVVTNDLIRLQILEEDGTDDPTITDLSMTIQ